MSRKIRLRINFKLSKVFSSFVGAGLADMLVFPTDNLSTKPAPTAKPAPTSFVSIICVNDIKLQAQDLSFTSYNISNLLG